ncbi:hypothetical protein Lal_00007112 [Lupinus albus]|nr:hypothetical protein Lal_00007112 [Lupinus albus]
MNDLVYGHRRYRPPGRSQWRFRVVHGVRARYARLPRHAGWGHGPQREDTTRQDSTHYRRGYRDRFGDCKKIRRGRRHRLPGRAAREAVARGGRPVGRTPGADHGRSFRSPFRHQCEGHAVYGAEGAAAAQGWRLDHPDLVGLGLQCRSGAERLFGHQGRHQELRALLGAGLEGSQDPRQCDQPRFDRDPRTGRPGGRPGEHGGPLRGLEQPHSAGTHGPARGDRSGRGIPGLGRVQFRQRCRFPGGWRRKAGLKRKPRRGCRPGCLWTDAAQIGQDVVDLLVTADTPETHLVAGDHIAGRLEEGAQFVFGPDEAGRGHRRGILEISGGTGLAPDHVGQLRTKTGARRRTYRVTAGAFGEGGAARRDIPRRQGGQGSKGNDEGECQAMIRAHGSFRPTPDSGNYWITKWLASRPAFCRKASRESAVVARHRSQVQRIRYVALELQPGLRLLARGDLQLQRHGERFIDPLVGLLVARRPGIGQHVVLRFVQARHLRAHKNRTQALLHLRLRHGHIGLQQEGRVHEELPQPLFIEIAHGRSAFVELVDHNPLLAVAIGKRQVRIALPVLAQVLPDTADDDDVGTAGIEPLDGAHGHVQLGLHGGGVRNGLFAGLAGVRRQRCSNGQDQAGKQAFDTNVKQSHGALPLCRSGQFLALEQRPAQRIGNDRQHLAGGHQQRARSRGHECYRFTDAHRSCAADVGTNRDRATDALAHFLQHIDRAIGGGLHALDHVATAFGNEGGRQHHRDHH